MKFEFVNDCRFFYMPFVCLFVFMLAGGPAVADKKNAAPDEFAAVPPATVLDDGDYVVDEPFPQWVVDRTPMNVDMITYDCSTGYEIPEWAQPLASGPVVCASEDEKSGEMWLATARGVTLLDLHDRRKMYFAGPRWLPDDNVTFVGAMGGGSSLAYTHTGAVILSRRTMTLEEKALYFEDIAQKRHNREGMIADAALAVPGDPASFILTDDDNDGQWTEMYLAAESFRYAATGDPAALAAARASFRAMVRLLTVSGVPGYPARSVLPAEKCPGKDKERWRMMPDGNGCWKSDTSVDELVGHYFGLPIYYDLAADEADREMIRGLITSLTDRMLAYGLVLMDENGKPTTHSQLNPEWVNTAGRTGDQGLNSLQALSMLRAAHHVTGNPKYMDAYGQLIRDHDYHKNTRRTKEIGDRFQVNHDSDEMALLCFYILIRYEDDPALSEKFYLEGLRRLWETDLPERNPEQIIAYGAFARKGFGLELAVRTLREIPLDLLYYDVYNGGRQDVKIDPAPDRFGNPQLAFLPPYTELRTMRWSVNMYQLDVAEGAHEEATPTFWLLPYWMARYHKLIRQPES